MTTRVDPSKSGTGHYASIVAALRAGRAEYVVPSGDAEAVDLHPDFTAASLNAFASSHSATSTTVTIDTGEGFVGGSWLATDTTTDVTLTGSTAGQTVYVGVDASTSDTAIIGTAGAFTSDDPKMPLHTYDTDASGVTSHTDERTLGRTTVEDDLTAKSATLGATEFNETGEPEQATGTGGGEAFRVGTGASDLVTVAGYDGQFHIAYNAYYDAGTNDWRYITGTSNAHAVTFKDGYTQLRTSATSNPTPDDPVTWRTTSLGGNGGLWHNGSRYFSGGVVEQDNLGGPASSLSTYPLEKGDVIDGSNATATTGVDSFSVQGYTPGDLMGGEWTVLDSANITATGSTLGYDSGTLTTTYDLYKVQVVYVNHASNPNYLECRLNGDATSSYYGLYASASSEIYNGGSTTEWQNIGKVDANQVGQGHLRVRGETPSSADASTAEYPTASVDFGGSPQHPAMLSGELRNEHPTVDRIELDSYRVASGKVKLLGMNVA